MADNFVDFKLVKERVSIESVLDHYNIRLRRVNKTSLRGACPLPTHSSEKSKESFCVETRKSIWSCQSTSCVSRDGKKGRQRSRLRRGDGELLDPRCCAQTSRLVFIGVAGAATSSSTRKGSEQTEKLVAEKKSGEKKVDDDVVVNKPLTFTLKDVDPTHPYLRQRGIKEETARNFGVGFFPGKGSMVGRVVIPIHNERGELVAYAGRSIDGTDPKVQTAGGLREVGGALQSSSRRVGVGDHR